MSKRRPKSKSKKIKAPKIPPRDTDLEPVVTFQELTTTPREHNDVVQYLPDDVEHLLVILTLVPPDLARCQCEWPDTSQPTFGPKPIVRCEHPPTVVAFQKRVHDTTDPTGAMALCDDHRVLIEHMYPSQLYYRAITHNQKIGEYVG